MTTEALKSAAITGFDTVPPTKPTAGAGGDAYLCDVSGYVTCTTGIGAGSTYQLVRLRSNAYIKNVILEGAALGSGTTMDFGVNYSDAPLDGVLDGTQYALAGTVIQDNFFANNFSMASATGITDIVNNAGNYTIDKRQEPIWQALGLSSDPGGYFDIVATTDSGITTGGLFGITVRYTQPNT